MSEPNLGLERAARGWEGGPRWGTSPRPLRSVGRELFSACVACGPIFTEWNPMPDDVDQLISRGEDQAPAQAPEPRPITSVRQADHCRSTADELCNQCWHRSRTCGRAPGAPFGPGRCFHSAETAERPVAPNLTQQSPSVPEMPGAEAIHLGSRAIDADTIGGSRGCGTKAERKRPPA